MYQPASPKEIAMYFRPARSLFGLIAVGGAVAVGVTTHDAGFTALTFVGGLLLPRILGFRGHRGHAWACAGNRGEHMRGRFEERMNAWHGTAPGETPTTPPVAPTASGA
jgi:hypothetical protein